MEEILDILKVIQSEQRVMRDEQREFRTEVTTRFEAMENRFETFETETTNRFETLEKHVIRNGEKLDNNRDYASKKISFIEHKHLELEQRVYELEIHLGQ